jgi:signal transduction histidine kinase
VPAVPAAYPGSDPGPVPQASGAPSARWHAIAARLHCGALLQADDGSLVTANDTACRLLGFDGEAPLRAQWPALSTRLGVASPPAAPRIVPRDGAGRGERLRVEMQPSAMGAGTLVLIASADSLDASDELLVSAARIVVQEQVMAGLLHDLGGPVNNLTLSLALLDATLARALAAAPDDATLTRCRRYVDTLQAQTARIAQWTREAVRAAGPLEPAPPPAPLAALIDEVRLMLRHHAAMNEVPITVAAGDPAVTARVDPAQLRLALLGMVIALVSMAGPGGAIAIDWSAQDAHAGVRLQVATAEPLPPGTLDAFDAVCAVPSAATAGLFAGRRIVETQGGSALLRQQGQRALIVDIELPRAT